MGNTLEGMRNVGIMEIEKQREEEMDGQVFENVTVTKDIETKKTGNFKKKGDNNSQIKRFIYYALGLLEVFFAFRFVFKILGANMESTFVSFIYSTTNLFLTPFTGIFRMAVSDGIETKSVLEPTLIIAMIVYALIAWGIVKLIDIISNRKDGGTLE
ncbi:MAG: hypothetical protein ACYDEX_16115 [Mobilitalea sp.]